MRWEWDIHLITQIDHNTDLVNFLTSTLNDLPEHIQTLLQFAVLVGNEFKGSLLESFAGGMLPPKKMLYLALAFALDSRYIVRVGPNDFRYGNVRLMRQIC